VEKFGVIIQIKAPEVRNGVWISPKFSVIFVQKKIWNKHIDEE